MLFVILLIALPLSFAMVQCRAPLRRWLALPPAVVVLMILHGLVFSLLVAVLEGMTGRRDTWEDICVARDIAPRLLPVVEARNATGLSKREFAAKLKRA